MKLGTRIILALAVAIAVGFGARYYDQVRGTEWEVSPQQIEQANTAGKTGVETRPGTVAVRAIRSETADLLPYKWALYGFLAGLLIFIQAGRRRKV